MSLPVGIRDYLIADSDVYALVEDRIYQQQADEQAAEPFCIISFLSDESPRNLAGKVMFTKVTYEIRVCGGTWESVDTLRVALKNAIGGPAGNSVEETLTDGENVIMHWSESPQTVTHVNANDTIRNQAALNLTVKVKSA
jgi:hypothetical protein